MMTFPHIRMWLMVALWLPTVGPATAQPLALHSPAFLFDDFTYPVEDAEVGRAGSLFGENTWLVGTVDTLRPVRTRAWYAQDWLDSGAAPAYERPLLVEEAGPFSIRTRAGALELRAEAGALVEVDAYVRSGFAHPTGTWVVRARLDNPAPPSDGRGPSEGTLDTYAPLWIQSANAMAFERYEAPWFTTRYEAPSLGVVQVKGWFEVNFEVWNPRRVNSLLCRLDPNGAHCPISTGVTWWGRTTAQRNPVLRPTAYSRWPGCRAGDDDQAWGEGVNLSQQDCYELLTEGRLWATFIIRVTDTHVIHTLLAREDVAPSGATDTDPDLDWLLMQTGTLDGQVGGARHFLPPAPMLSTMSMKVSTGDRPLEEDMLLAVDWFYYTPNTEGSVSELLDDVAAIRRYGSRRADYAGRVNTTGQPTTPPLVNDPYLRDRYTECTWVRPFAAQIRGPYRHPDRPDGPLYFEARQDPGPDGRGLRQTTYRARWVVTEVYADGTTYTDTLEGAGYTYAYEGPRRRKTAAGIALDRLELTLTLTDLDQVDFQRSAQCATDPDTATTRRTFRP
ncbi:MAG: hypothetical protein AAF970_04320 [Bacteroidota bacterium]